MYCLYKCDSTFRDGLVLKKQSKITIHCNIESQFLKKITIHIALAPKYRDSIKSGGRCIVPALISPNKFRIWILNLHVSEQLNF